MRIAIMGTGGLGAYLGGKLTQSGQDVHFIARGAQLKALHEQGLRVRSYQGEVVLNAVQATDKPAAVGPVDLVLLCVKAYDAVPAAEQMKSLLGPQTAIVPVLNGIDHLATLREIVGAEHVLGGQISMTAHMLEPGLVERVGQHGAFEFGEVQGGISARCEAIEQVLSVEGIQAKAVPNIMAGMWQKFAAICGFAMFSVVRGDAAAMRRSPEAIALIGAGVTEVRAVAEAKGIHLDPPDLERAKAFWANVPDGFKPSMLVDLEKGRRIEVEALNGSLSRLGREVGVPTPVNDFIYACLKPHTAGVQ